MEGTQHFIVPYKFQEEIKNYVKNVCSLLPKTVTEPCKQFIEEYGDLVIALLAQSLDPNEVCSAIKACKAAEPKRAVLIGE